MKKYKIITDIETGTKTIQTFTYNEDGVCLNIHYEEVNEQTDLSKYPENVIEQL